ncbi:MAG: YtxH domain-containing protein [Terriglobia bacterium]|jgi:gas vesicle protein
MCKCGIAAKVGFFVAGAGIGALLALLLAPKTGEQTRKLIAKKAEEGKDYVASKGREFRGQAEELVEKGKELVTKKKERLAEVLETGKEAARSTLSKV